MLPTESSSAVIISRRIPKTGAAKDREQIVSVDRSNGFSVTSYFIGPNMWKSPEERSWPYAGYFSICQHVNCTLFWWRSFRDGVLYRAAVSYSGRILSQWRNCGVVWVAKCQRPRASGGPMGPLVSELETKNFFLQISIVKNISLWCFYLMDKFRSIFLQFFKPEWYICSDSQ
jgi:hypothetical protein